MGYADDTTLLSTLPEDHQSALKDIDCKCSDLGLEIRPINMHYVFDGQKVNDQTTFIVHQGSNCNITSAPINSYKHQASLQQEITKRVYVALNKIDWDTSEENTKLGPTNSTWSLLKCWLHIQRSAPLASIFHPDVTNFPYLPHVQEKAKLKLLAQVHLSQDRSIKEIEDIILDPEIAKRESIPPRTIDILSRPLLPSPSMQTIALMK